MTNPLGTKLENIEVTVPIWEYKQMKNFHEKNEKLREENSELRKEINKLRKIISNVIK
jgi:hypothetical protein